MAGVDRAAFLRGPRARGTRPLPPPWAVDGFRDYRTRCDACIEVCSTGALERESGRQRPGTARVAQARLTDRWLTADPVRVAVLSISTGRMNKEFVDRHVAFRKGAADIGCGLRPEHPSQKAAANAAHPAAAEPIDFDAYKAFVARHTVDEVAALSGVPAEKLVELAEL